ncbi:hypothetical protein [Tardiphaga sp.]|uniref:hypothetical protein n=1 Tax=Tardiphaga sp. TaxID=1926292 RepID=UPI0037D9AC20
MKLIDLYVLLLPVVGVIFMLAIGRIGSRRLREETARAREAERKAREPAPHTTR